jgi:threonine/homoserine/homoserine lactone efflux protein
MEPGFFIRGAALGFAIAAPVGPIGILCIRRSAEGGPRLGLATGAGAAVADALYGSVAAFGLTAVSRFLVGERFWLQLLGGLFLCYLGFKTMWSRADRTSPSAPSPTGSTLLAAAGSTFLLTLANPATMLSFVAVFAGFGLGHIPGYSSAAALVAGVFTGSLAWWLILSQGVGLYSSRFTPGWIHGINRISGGVLVGFGVAALIAAWRVRIG